MVASSDGLAGFSRDLNCGGQGGHGGSLTDQ
jgi:hypothetical protein